MADAGGRSEPGGAFRERRFTSQDGLSLYYRDYGDALAPGVPVLCLAGLSRNSRDYHGLALHLAESRRVVCPDYRGRGRSDYDPVWRNYQPATYVGDLKQLLAAAGLHKAAIVGTSMGGILAMAMAVAAPTAVAGAVLNDVGPDIDRSGVDRIIAWVGTDRPQPTYEAAAELLKETLPDLNLGKDENWVALARQTYWEGNDGRLHFDWDTRIAEPLKAGSAPLPDLWPLFRALASRPMLAIRGALSDVLSADTLERMKTEAPHLQTVVIPRKGHAPNLTEPASLRAIDAFLARLDGA